MQLQRNGGGTGWTRGLVNSFLMRNGLPIYAAGSGYNPEWENQGIKATLTIVVVELLQNIIVLTLLHSITGNDTSLIVTLYLSLIHISYRLRI